MIIFVVSQSVPSTVTNKTSIISAPLFDDSKLYSSTLSVEEKVAIAMSIGEEVVISQVFLLRDAAT